MTTDYLLGLVRTSHPCKAKFKKQVTT